MLCIDDGNNCLTFCFVLFFFSLVKMIDIDSELEMVAWRQMGNNNRRRPVVFDRAEKLLVPFSECMWQFSFTVGYFVFF